MWCLTGVKDIGAYVLLLCCVLICIAKDGSVLHLHSLKEKHRRKVYMPFHFQHFKDVICCLLVSIVSVEKSAISLVSVPFEGCVFFS